MCCASKCVVHPRGKLYKQDERTILTFSHSSCTLTSKSNGILDHPEDRDSVKSGGVILLVPACLVLSGGENAPVGSKSGSPRLLGIGGEATKGVVGRKGLKTSSLMKKKIVTEVVRKQQVSGFALTVLDFLSHERASRTSDLSRFRHIMRLTNRDNLKKCTHTLLLSLFDLYHILRLLKIPTMARLKKMRINLWRDEDACDDPIAIVFIPPGSHSAVSESPLSRDSLY